MLKVYTDYYHTILKTPKFRCTALAVFVLPQTELGSSPPNGPLARREETIIIQPESLSVDLTYP